jgi:hypothetical protein
VSAANPEYLADLAALEADLARLVRRLRGLSAGAWRERRAAVVILLEQLAAASAELENRALPSLPEVPNHVFPDALAVIGGDVVNSLNTEPDTACAARALGDLRVALEATR